MMRTRRRCDWKAAAMAACVCAVLGLGGCGEQKPVVLVPVAPTPVPVTLDEIVTKAQAGEGEWQIIWAVRQSRRAMPLTAADVGRLREAGVSDRAIDFMLDVVSATVQYRSVPLTVEEVAGLKAAGVPDEDVIAEISYTGTIFHLRAADVVALRAQGVSDEVIDFMLYTRQLERPAPTWRVLPAGM